MNKQPGLLKKVNLSKEYKNCVVAFIDISGYKQHIKNIENAQDMIDAIVDVVNDTITAVGKAFTKYNDPPIQVNILSDSIILSSLLHPNPKTEEEYWSVFTPIMMEFMTSSRIQMEFMKRGFLVNGGISYGLFYRNDYIVFGEALAKAVNLQNNTNEPIISVDSHLIDAFINSMDRLNIRPDDDTLGRILRKDGDRPYSYLHYVMAQTYFAQMINPNYKTTGIDVLTEHRDGLIKAIERNNGNINAKAAAKYKWSIDYHNETNTSGDETLNIPNEMEETIRIKMNNQQQE